MLGSEHEIRLKTRFKTRLLFSSLFILTSLIFSGGSLISAVPASAARNQTPGKRTGQQMVYDPVSDQIILYGGNRGNGDQTELESIWRYSINSSAWEEFSPEDSPAPRFSHKMIYLPRNRSVFLFGGSRNSDYTRLTDTWLYHLDNNTWEDVSPLASPSSRSDTAITYDSLRNRVLLFGGYGGDDTKKSDLWAYYPNNNTWVELNPSNHPPGDYGHSLLYRDNGDTVYAFERNEYRSSNDIWEYDSETNSWSLLSISSPKPGWRYWHCMEYANRSDTGFLFGGDYNNVALDETWIYNFTANSWSEPDLGVSPPGRVVFSMCYEFGRDQMFIYGGLGEDYSVCQEDFWKFNFETMDWEEIGSSSGFSIPGYPYMGIWIIWTVGIVFVAVFQKCSNFSEDK